MFDLRFSLPQPTTFLVRLIDRRTGESLMIDGEPLRIFTREPAAAARDLMARRSRVQWEIRVDPLGTASA